MVSSRVTSPHFAQFDSRQTSASTSRALTCLAWSRFFSSLLFPHRLASSRIVSHRLASSHIVSHRLASYRAVSHRPCLVSSCFISSRLASSRIASHRIAQSRIDHVSSRLVSSRETRRDETRRDEHFLCKHVAATGTCFFDYTSKMFVSKTSCYSEVYFHK